VWPRIVPSNIMNPRQSNRRFLKLLDSINLGVEKEIINSPIVITQ